MIRALPYLLAASVAIFYAWEMSQTRYATTALQFVTPFLLITLVHAGWLACSRIAIQDAARTVLARSTTTAIGLVLFVFVAEIVAPMPSQASGAGQAVQSVLVVLFCVLILAIVGAAIGLVLYYTYRLLRYLFRGATKQQDKDDDTSLREYGSLGFVCAFLAVASLEGLPWAYSFDGKGQVAATLDVNAPSTAVWDSMQTATHPSFPLPGLLHSFPQPVAVLTDEGTDLNANRVVLIRGREGQGKLRLQVVARDPTTARFKVLGDSSPMARWIGFDALIYKVEPRGQTTRLSVQLEYERKLAPAWFFDPMMKGAAWLAMDVLARDTKIRAETMSDPSGNRI